MHDDRGNLLLDVLFADDPDARRACSTSAALVVEATFGSGRLNALPLETRACLAEWDARDQRLAADLHPGPAPRAHDCRRRCLRLPEHRMRVVAPDVGGGFGQKCVVGREETLAVRRRARLAPPVKWIEDRQENLSPASRATSSATTCAPASTPTAGCSALDAVILCDVGAYSRYPFTAGVEPLMAATEMPGPTRSAATACGRAPCPPTRRRWRPIAA